MLVGPPLVFGLREVRLHPHVEHVAGVADYAAAEAREGGHQDEAAEGEFGLGVARGGFGREACLEVFVDAEADGTVSKLAEEGGAEAIVEAEDALGAEDGGEGREHRFGGVGSAGLETNFDFALLVDCCVESVSGIPRSSGCVTTAAMLAALPPNQNG